LVITEELLQYKLSQQVCVAGNTVDLLTNPPSVAINVIANLFQYLSVRMLEY